MTSGDPLTGRDSELDVVRHALTGGGKYSGVLIVGAAGVGKTRLAQEVLARAEAAGQRTQWIVGTESARPLPLGAFTASVGDAVSGLMPNVRLLINSFVAQQRQSRVVLGVDDAHLLDGLSAHVVHQIAQAHGARLVVTLRAGSDEPDAVTALWKDGLLARLDLEPLRVEASRDLLETALGGPMEAHSANRFWKLTGGNVLFLRQLLKDQLAAGRLRQVAGVWMWDDDVAVSPSIGDMVGRQLGQLTPELALVVDTLTQCEPLAVDVLCDLVRRADLEVAEEMNLVTVERTGGELTARLAHPLYGEVRRATAGELHLSSIRGRLARRLRDDPDRDPHVTVRRALLTLDSDLDADPELYLESARIAMTLLDLDLADRFATAAVQAGASEAVGVQAMNLVLLGRGDEAETVLRRIGADSHLWSTVRAANLTWMVGRPVEAQAVLDSLTATAESDAERAGRAAMESCVDAVLGRCETAGEKARAALCSATLPDFHAMMASVALTMAMGALGQVDDLTAVAQQAIDRATTSFQASHMRFWYGGVYARACRLTGRIDECVRMAKQLADSAVDVPSLTYANIAFLLGQADLMRGDILSAAKLLHESLAGVERHSIITGLRQASRFSLAEAHAKLGQAAAASEALTAAESCVPPDYLFMETALSVAKGWVLAASGSLADAIATVQSAAQHARDRKQPTHELSCLQAAAQWGDTSGAVRVRELADALPISLANAVARHIESLLINDGEGLLAASAEYRAIGDRATAADVAAQAAVAFSRHNRRRRGLYAASIARELADECGGLCTPALRSPVSQPLTGRQREVVELVVAGLSNRAIAEHLVMSVRSVEGHVYRACQRVGANSRDELSAIIRAGPVVRP